MLSRRQFLAASTASLAAGPALAQSRVTVVPAAWSASAPPLPEPLATASTLARTEAALINYRDLVARTRWAALPATARAVTPNGRSAAVPAIKERLAFLGDLAPTERSDTDVFDAAASAALARFQERHGLTATGAMGPLTLQALNVPVARRLEALEASLARLLPFAGGEPPRRHIVVNLPGASLEAVSDGRIERRHRAVVGRRDRPSPVLASRVTSVNLNPHWTIPRSIAAADILPRLAREPDFLVTSRMRFITFTAPGVAQEIEPALADVYGGPVTDWWIRQDPGPWNALGQVRFDMPNAHDVFMHDTPQRNLFRADVRFNSSGCARIADVRDLAAWMLAGSGVDRARIDREIATNERRDFRLAEPIPVAWVYITAWGASDGTVQFRDDIYGLDAAGGVASSTVAFAAPARPRPRQQPAAADPIVTGTVRARPAAR